MLTKEFALQAVKDMTLGYDRSNCSFLDSRDYHRLCSFYPVEELGTFGFILNNDASPEDFKVLEWNEATVKSCLAEDLDFAFEKAINQRGISSALMCDVIHMWMWILEDPLATDSSYEPYGIPFYSKVAIKYNLPDMSEQYWKLNEE